VQRLVIPLKFFHHEGTKTTKFKNTESETFVTFVIFVVI